MAKVKATTILEEFIDFLVEKATPESILAFKAPDTLSERLEELVTRSKDDELSPDEQQELEAILAYDRLASLMKAKARQV